MSNQLSVKEVLIKAKELIDTPEKWIKDVYHRKIGGDNCYCALGAIGQVTGVNNFNVADTPASLHLRSMVADELFRGQTFAVYNDNHTHAEIMDVFDKAIAVA